MLALLFVIILAFPVILKAGGAILGAGIGIVAALGAAAFVAFVLLMVFGGAGILVIGAVGLVAIILLAVALPFLAPLFIIALPVFILVKIFSR